MLVHGVLEGEQAGPMKRTWYTTTGAVAELMARRSLAQVESGYPTGLANDAAGSAQKAIATTHFAQKSQDDLQGAYGDAMSDYFLALMFRRKFLARGVAFQRTVFYGQLVVVMLLVSTCATAAWAALKPEPAHRTAVRDWISNNETDYKIKTWYPPRPNPAGDGQLVPVRYRYSLSKRRAVETERTFVVVEGAVIRQFNEEDEDG
jgi:hypothetical protein